MDSSLTYTIITEIADALRQERKEESLENFGSNIGLYSRLAEETNIHQGQRVKRNCREPLWIKELRGRVRVELDTDIRHQRYV